MRWNNMIDVTRYNIAAVVVCTLRTTQLCLDAWMSQTQSMENPNQPNELGIALVPHFDLILNTGITDMLPSGPRHIRYLVQHALLHAAFRRKA
jgi:hypothetical protein